MRVVKCRCGEKLKVKDDEIVAYCPLCDDEILLFDDNGKLKKNKLKKSENVV